MCQLITCIRAYFLYSIWGPPGWHPWAPAVYHLHIMISLMLSAGEKHFSLPKLML